MRIFVILLFSYLVLFVDEKNENCFDGKWSLCKIEYDDEIELYNICYEIDFYNKNKGIIILPCKEQINFDYKIDEHINKITFIFYGKQNLFLENIYNYYAYDCYDLQCLKLFPNDKCMSYILTKQ